MQVVGSHREAACAAHVRAVETLRDGESVRRGWLMRLPNELGDGWLLRVEGEREATSMTLREIQSLAIPVRYGSGADEVDNVWWRTLLEAAEALT